MTTPKRVQALAARRRAQVRLRGDDGTTLIELLVGMILLTIFMSMFTAAVISMNRAENKTEAVNLSSGQLSQAFLALDRTVRYASAISVPDISRVAGGTADWYVEIRSTNVPNGTAPETCTQLRVDRVSKLLQRRTWTVTNAVASAPSAWVPIAINISNGGVAVTTPTSPDQPFVTTAPGATIQFQQLSVNLVSPSGPASSVTTSRSSFGFTATNSSLPLPTGPICQEVGRP